MQTSILHFESETTIFELEEALRALPLASDSAEHTICFALQAAQFERLTTGSGVHERVVLYSRLEGRRGILITRYLHESKAVFRRAAVDTSPICAPADMSDAEMRALRAADFSTLAQIAHDIAVVDFNPQSHLVAPSLRHTPRFFRVGNLVSKREWLYRLSYWVVPHLLSTDALLFDTWSVAPIILRALLDSGRGNIPYDGLFGHPEQFKTECEAQIRALCEQMPTEGILTVIMSAVSSGMLLQQIRTLIKNAGVSLERVRFVSLFGYMPVEGCDTFAFVDACGPSFDAGDCRICEENNRATTVVVHPIQYYPTVVEEVVSPNDGKFENHPEFRSGVEFVRKWASLPGFLKVHARNRNDGRFHWVYPDVGVLMQCTEFREEIKEDLKGLCKKADAVVVIDHDVGHVIAKYLSEELGEEALLSETLDPRGMQLPDVERLKGVSSVLVIDDALIGGARIQSVAKNLRDHFPNIKNIEVYVLLCRPDSHLTWRRAERQFQYNPDLESWKIRFHAKLYLPEVDRVCSWCDEQRYLKAVARLMGFVPRWIMDRLQHLGDEDGITCSFVCEDRFGPVPGIVSGSPLISKCESVDMVCYELVVVLQTMRGCRERLLDPGWPSQRALGESAFSQFTDTSIWIAFLRMTNRVDWTRGGRVKLVEAVGNCLRKTSSPTLAYEVCLAGWRGVFTSPEFEKLTGDISACLALFDESEALLTAVRERIEV